MFGVYKFKSNGTAVEQEKSFKFIVFIKNQSDIKLDVTK